MEGSHAGVPAGAVQLQGVLSVATLNGQPGLCDEIQGSPLSSHCCHHPLLVSLPTAGSQLAAPTHSMVPGPLPALGFSGAPFTMEIRQLSVLKDLDETR